MLSLQLCTEMGQLGDGTTGWRQGRWRRHPWGVSVGSPQTSVLTGQRSGEGTDVLYLLFANKVISFLSNMVSELINSVYLL